MKRFLTYMRQFRTLYIATFAVAAIWFLFFDRYNLMSQIRVHNRIKTLEKDLNYYKQEQANKEARGELLNTNMEELERFAREKYWMKKADEDLFVVVEE